MARAALGLLAALALLPGCVRSVPTLATDGPGEEPGVLPPPPPGGWVDLDKPYPLLPGDQIEVRLLEPAEFAFTFTETLLPPDGEFELLRSGTEGKDGRGRRSVKAKGKTVTELKDEIARIYKEVRFETLPFIQVTLLQAAKRVVYLQGAVETETGVLELPPGGRMTLFRAIHAAGGPTEDADLSRVRISRRDPATGTEVSLPIYNLQEMEDTATYDRDPPLEPNDRISVPKLGRVWISGEVNEPGPKLCKRKMTLLKLVAEAGGFKQFAKLGQVLVIRGEEGTSRERTYYVDVNAIFDGKAPDPLLVAGDRVFVEEDWK
jgi:protein involved in polysaccharide export with SLBB domain